MTKQVNDKTPSPMGLRCKCKLNTAVLAQKQIFFTPPYSGFQSFTVVVTFLHTNSDVIQLRNKYN